ncbi:HNH endonuclease [Citrobacter portucalensis]|uniref:HNH endonuclease n=2 Tax=Citrobacter portucalensis TaxID=1639133 RepID=UPI001C63FD26|nr:HNH endonuclease signature motif containing protein [Citrobacter portucalensis]MBW7619198.1 HNH endonuclease [Citrobacter portucalensis]MBW7638457.1 HNH endonuclease [Citrobacter portucalensis]MCA2132730.1 HNH endonuclease [Citrobacter portucalensis]MCA2142764.1 HNH endonuclease [Citrobacter portucalensis]MCA2146621.1 HNH endonuclease [Citrobacter portucalensis]
MNQKAWSFKAVGQDDLRYFGNNGYQDDFNSFYKYDNFVPNHKQVKKGDIVIITDRKNVLGISIIDNLSSSKYFKVRNRCPHNNCTPVKLTHRKNKKPEWRCSNGHEFEQPKLEKVPAIAFKAEYNKNHKPIKSVSMKDLISHTPRYNVQSSIQEIEFEWANNLLGDFIPSVATEADTDDTTLDEKDQRKAVLRQIKQRRGQKSFRDSLLSQTSKCAITNCEIVDILEAAHITAYRNDTHNHVSNGLLLRCDMHTLYDLDLFAINPDSFIIYFAPQIKDKEYTRYHGGKLHVSYKINREALLERWKIFSEKHAFNVSTPLNITSYDQKTITKMI